MSDYLIRRTKPLSETEAKVLADNLGLIGDVIRRNFKMFLGHSQVQGRPGVHGDKAITYADLFGAGYFGIIAAIEKHEPARGSFSTAAEWWIKNKIWRWLREFGYVIHIPKWVLQLKRPLNPSEIEALPEGALKQTQGAMGPGEREKLTKQFDREQRLMGRAKTMKPMDEALDHAITTSDTERLRQRMILMRLIYSVQPETDEERTGRLIMVKMAGLDGGTPVEHRQDKDVFDEIARSLGMAPNKAKRCYEAFMEQVRMWIADNEMEYPLGGAED